MDDDTTMLFDVHPPCRSRCFSDFSMLKTTIYSFVGSLSHCCERLAFHRYWPINSNVIGEGWCGKHQKQYVWVATAGTVWRGRGVMWCRSLPSLFTSAGRNRCKLWWMFSLVPVTDCPYSNSRQLLWLSTLGADTVHGSRRHVVQPGRERDTAELACKHTQRYLCMPNSASCVRQEHILIHLMITDRSSTPVAFPHQGSVCMPRYARWFHSENYHAKRENGLKGDTTLYMTS